MEGEGSKPLPQEGSSKGSSMKLVAAIIVVILIIAAIGGALLLTGGKKENVAPTAAFTASGSEVGMGGSVAFDGSASNDTDGSIASYQWNFGDNTGLVTSTAKVVHNYYLAGLFQVQLTVVDDGGAKGVSTVAPVSVPAAAIEASNTSSPRAVITTSADAANNIVNIGDTLTFTGNLSYDYTWNNVTKKFDLNTSAIAAYDWLITPATVKHRVTNTTTFATAGVYCLMLTVTDKNNGLTDSLGVSIVVQAGGGSAPTGSVYTHATIGEPQSLDPAWDYESAGGNILQQIYETLVFYNGSSAVQLKPMLALQVPTVENGLISPDGLNYTFHLRPGVKFHDGNTMTADDVVYSFKRVLIMNDGEGPAWMLGSIMIPGFKSAKALSVAAIDHAITKVDNMTVKFTLLSPYPAFLYILAYTVCSVVEKSYVEAHGGVASLTRNSFMNRNEMGTGPYVLKEWSANNRILLQRYDNYWRGPASLQFVIVKKVQDLGTREMLLFSGKADSIYVPVMFKADVENKLAQGVKTYSMLPMFSINFFGLNEKINKSNPSVPTGDVPVTFFNDTNVRKAFAYCLNYTTLLDVIAQGTAIQPNGPIPQGMFGYNTSVPKFNFDLAKAAQFLKAALDPRTTTNTTDTYATNGFTLYLYYNAGNLGRQAGCQLIKQGLESLGSYGVTGAIHVNVQSLDWPTYLDARAKGWLPMFFLGWNVDYPDPDDFANPFCADGGAFPIYINLVNLTLDQLVKDAATELNTTLRAELYGKIAQSCYDNAYYIWTTQPTNFHVERTWVHGFNYNPTWADLPGLFYDLSKT